jgi:hypothetical protein
VPTTATIVDVRRFKLRSHLSLDNSMVIRYEDLLTDGGIDKMVSEVASQFRLKRHGNDSTDATSATWHGGQARHAWLPTSTTFDAATELARFHDNYYRSLFSADDQAFVLARLDVAAERRVGYDDQHIFP